MSDGFKEILQRDLEMYLEFERVTVPLRQRLIDLVLNGASIEPGRLTVNRKGLIQQVLVVDNLADSNVAAHVMMDSFRAVVESVRRGEYDDWRGDLPRELVQKIHNIRHRNMMTHCRRLEIAAWAAWRNKAALAMASRNWHIAGLLIADRLRLIQLGAAIFVLGIAVKKRRTKVAYRCLVRIELSYASLMRS